MKLETFFKKHKVFIFAGNGGTGKTTLSATWALEAAHQGYRVGLITIDPSRRLGEIFGMDVLKDDYKRQIVGKQFLDIYLIQSQKTIRDFIIKNFSQKKYDELMSRKLFKQVVTRLAENQSVSTIYQLAQLLQSSDYDLIVVDTPPASHTADFFRSPQNTIRIFKENILAKAVFEGNNIAARTSKKFFTNILGLLTGFEFVQQMELFFSAFFLFQEEVVRSAEYLAQQLQNQTVGYFLVTSPEPQKVQELENILLDVEKQGIQSPHLIVNRAYPDWLGLQKQEVSDRWPVSKNYYDKIFNYYDNQRKSIEAQIMKKRRPIDIYFVPERNYFSEELTMDQLRETLRGVFQ